MFLEEPALTPDVQALFDADREDPGYVMNLTRLWAWQPETITTLFELMGRASSILTTRQKAILVTACASTLGDSYCSLAWGTKLAVRSDAVTAAAVATGGHGELTGAERAMADWARRITSDPNRTTPADVAKLRAVGFSDAEIFAMTVYVGLRIAFSTVNDALGAAPDAELVDRAPESLLRAVTFGREPAVQGDLSTGTSVNAEDLT